MNYTELHTTDRALLQSAINAADRLYVPGIQEVGAAVGTAGGQIFAGIHFETATGFANICGEVAAICCMVRVATNLQLCAPVDQCHRRKSSALHRSRSGSASLSNSALPTSQVHRPDLALL